MSEMTIQEKITNAAVKAGMYKTELGLKLGYSQSNWSQLLKRGKFSESDLKRIGDVIGAKYYSGFEFEDGTIIGDVVNITTNKETNLSQEKQEKKEEQYDEIIDNLDKLLELMTNIVRLADEE